MRKTPLRGGISTAKLTVFCLERSKVGSSAKGNLRNEKILLLRLLQEMTSSTKRASPLRARRDLIRSKNQPRRDKAESLRDIYLKNQPRRDKAESLRDIFLQSLPAPVIFPGQDGRHS